MVFTEQRHSKSTLQMYAAYGGASLSVSLSIALSVLLFWTISENLYYSVLFAGIAVVLELAKFMALPEIARRKQRQDWVGMLSTGLLFLILASASILGSIGGLQSDTQRVQASIMQQTQKREALIEQRQLLLNEIAENQQAIDRYIALNRIKHYAQPLQAKNQTLREQVTVLQHQIDAVGVAHETAMTALLGAIATALDEDKATVQVYVFILLAVLLDLVASFFIELIREENHFKASLIKVNQTVEGDTFPSPCKPTKKSDTLVEKKTVPPLRKTELVESDTPALTVESNVVSIKRVSALEKYAAVKQAVSTLGVGEGVYKRQMMKDFQLGQKTVDKHYRWLIRDGLVMQDDETKLFYRAA